MKRPLRLRAWHSGIVDDAEGNPVCNCNSVPDAKLLITCVNAFDGIDLTMFPDGSMHFEAKPQVSAAAELIDQLERRAARMELALRKIIEAPGGGPAKRIATMALDSPDTEPVSLTGTVGEPEPAFKEAP